jgi:SUKH-4 immunity protein
MDPIRFKARFLHPLPKQIPADLHLDVSTFVIYSPADFRSLILSKEDRYWLEKVGFPQDAAPYLNFGHCRYPRELVPAEYVFLGSTNDGDLICLEPRSGNVVRLDHETVTGPFLINSSLSAFAECLCLFREHLAAKSLDKCLEAMAAVDAVVVGESEFWKSGILSRAGGP